MAAATAAGVPTNDCRPVISMTSSRSDRFLASASARHSFAMATGSRYIRTLARPWAIGVLADDRVLGGQRAVGVVVGQVAVPQLLERT